MMRQLLGQRLLGDLRVAGHLSAQPVAVGEAEEAAQAQVGIGGQGTPISMARRYCGRPIGLSNSSCSSAPGVTGLSFCIVTLLVVVHDRDVFGAGRRVERGGGPVMSPRFKISGDTGAGLHRRSRADG